MMKRQKMQLMAAIREFAWKQMITMAGQGEFHPFFVSIDFPGTAYEGLLFVETDICEAATFQIRTAMRPQKSPKIVSHYLLKGSCAKLTDWLAEEVHEVVLLDSYERLKLAVDRFE